MVTRWFLRIGFVALLALMPCAGWAPWMVTVLLLPLGCALWRAENERLAPTVALAMLTVAAAMRVSGQADAHLLVRLFVLQEGISLVCLVVLWQSFLRDALKKSLCMAFALALACAAALLCYSGEMVEELAALFGTWNRADEVLLRLYASGLLDVEAPARELAPLRLLGVMTGEVREQLMLAFAQMMDATLRNLLPRIVVGYGMLMAAACAWASEAIREKRVGWRELPRFYDWHLPRGWGLKVVMLNLGGLVSFFTQSSTAALFGQICVTVCTTAFFIQGMAAGGWWLRDKKVSTVAAIALGAGLCVLMPFMLTLIGYMDQLVDPRRLRKVLVEWDDQDMEE